MLRGILRLSLGTAAARALAAVGQLLLALWLTPAEFGYWAAATSVIAILTGLANFGEVNGYLSGQGGTFSGTRRAILNVNTVLACGGTVIAGIYLISGRPEVAILAVISALTIPLVGDAELMYSSGVKLKLYRRVVLAQVLAAVSKVAVGLILALTLQSALAFAVSTVVFYAIMDLAIFRRLPRQEGAGQGTSEAPTRHIRLKWGVNSLFITLPLQASFVVAQFGASAEVLGVYYFAYQISLGLSGLVSVPLARVSLSTLADTRPEERVALSLRLCQFFVLVVTAVSAAFSLFMPLFAGVLGGQWVAASGAVVILLASLPVRMMTPILDGLQQAQGRWWQGTAFNIVDTVGTACAALASFTGDITTLVCAVAGWKVIFGLGRAAWLMRTGRNASLLWVLFFTTASSASIAASQFLQSGLVVLGAVLLASLLSLAVVARWDG